MIEDLDGEVPVATERVADGGDGVGAHAGHDALDSVRANRCLELDPPRPGGMQAGRADQLELAGREVCRVEDGADLGGRHLSARRLGDALDDPRELDLEAARKIEAV